MTAIGDIITVDGRRERIVERELISRPAELPDGTRFRLAYYALRAAPLEGEAAADAEHAVRLNT